jgi:putative ABC transport system permease protein
VTPAARRERVERAERWYRRLLCLYPRAFRERFSGDLLELFRDLHTAHALDATAFARARFWYGLAKDACRQSVIEHVQDRRRMRLLPLGAHRAKGASTMSLLIDDLRHAIRALRAQPAVTAVIVLTLTLGIGANSAIFTVVNAVLLRPLPFHAPDRIVMLYEVDPGGADRFVSIPAFEDWRESLTTIDGLSAMASQTANLTGVPEPDRLRAGFVTSAFFDMLGVQPIIGRAFAAGDDRPGAAKTALLAYGTWAQRFGSDPALVGRALMLNNEPHEIVGVLAPRFEFPIDAVDVWMPLSSLPNANTRLYEDRRNRNFMVFGRLSDGVSADAAGSELRSVSARLATAHPESSETWSARFEPFHDVTVRGVSRNLTLLAGAVACVLLIACANIANLLLVRASTRQREMALRAALGASRARLLRQLLGESVLMALAGGGLGLVLGAALTDAMLTLVPNLPRADGVGPDTIVIAFTMTLSCLTGLLFGVVPAWRTARVNVRTTLNETVRTGDSPATGRMRAALVVCELALSLMLLVGAALLVQSLYRVLTVDIGYNPDRVLTLEYRLPVNKYQTPPQQWAFHRRVVDAIARVPGIEAASLARAAPQSGNGSYIGYWKDGDQPPHEDQMARAQFNAVTPGFFRAMGIPVRGGRVCTDDDTPDAPMTAVVNRHLAERLWPGESALDRQLRSPGVPGPVVIVGVVGDTRPRLLSMPVTAQIYGCLSQSPGLFATVIARTTGEPMAVARSVQQAIWSVDRDQPMWKIRSGDMLVAGSVQTQRFVVLLMSSAAALALLLAGLGTYSVLSFMVQRRAREVGVRMALGATRADVLRLVLSQTALITAIGILTGLAGALALSRVLASQLFEVSPRDPLTFVVTSLLLLAVAMLAAWLPARRATLVDPIVTLRAE